MADSDSELDGPTVTVGFTPEQANVVKYAIRQHADGEESPVEKAQSILSKSGYQMMAPLRTEETMENPASAEELRAQFSHNRFECNRSYNEQIQMLLLVLQMVLREDPQRYAEATETIGGALERLTEAADELWDKIPDDQREEELDGGAKDVLREVLQQEGEDPSIVDDLD